MKIAADFVHWDDSFRLVPNAAIVIEDEHIVGLDTDRSGADFDFGDCHILPGFVNAHVHLDLGGMRGLAAPCLPMTTWLRQVISHRRAHNPEQTLTDIRQGIAECLRSGTTLVGDISGDGRSAAILAESPLRAVVFREVLGLSAERVDLSWAHFQQWEQENQHRLPVGISPHAPYSTSHRLYQRAAHTNHPLMTHLAESREEEELLRSRTGPFVDFLKELGAWDEKGLSRSIEEIVALLGSRANSPNNAAQRLLLAHGNYLPRSLSPPAETTIVYCPRTHAAFGHDEHPLGEMSERGWAFALGTDSLASNPDLDMRAEIRLVQQKFPQFDRSQLLRLATLNGATALGLGHKTGSLKPQKLADLVCIRGTDPFAEQSEIVRVMIAGRFVSCKF
jgi:cytosine/adenosine deaminase-related metal-dependent hydrolase